MPFAATMFSGMQLILPSAGQVEKGVYRDIPVEKVVEVEKVGTDPDRVVPCLLCAVRLSKENLQILPVVMSRAWPDGICREFGVCIV